MRCIKIIMKIHKAGSLSEGKVFFKDIFFFLCLQSYNNTKQIINAQMLISIVLFYLSVSISNKNSSSLAL